MTQDLRPSSADNEASTEHRHGSVDQAKDLLGILGPA